VSADDRKVSGARVEPGVFGRWRWNGRSLGNGVAYNEANRDAKGEAHDVAPFYRVRANGNANGRAPTHGHRMVTRVLEVGSVRRILLLSQVLMLPLAAQLISNPQAIPRTGKPPVVFLNGFETNCGSVTFQTAFGIADQVLQANGRASLFFNNCSIAGSPSIEKLGAAFGSFLTGMRYSDGQAVDSVDVVAYSMGGLILRSYLTGKQEAQATFTPPASIPIGKAIFIATPHFGTPVGALALGLSVQADELSSGSHFLMDLNTWNQDRADLRGIDAIAVAGTGGTGVATMPGFDDGLVASSSASLAFYARGRTRLLPLCHVSSGGLLTQVGLCPSNATGIAKITAASDDTARIIVSFLNGTADWQSIGTAAEDNMFLATGGGLLVRARTAGDQAIDPSSVRATPPAGPAKDLNMSNSEIAYTDLIAAGTESLMVNAGSASFSTTVNLPAGGTRAFVLKPGPHIAAVIPAPAAVTPLVVAPRMIVSIYGVGMAQATVEMNGTAMTTLYVSDTQINAIVSADAPLGLNKLSVKTSAGSHTVNVMLEGAYPAVFTPGAANGTNGMLVSDSNPLHAGEYVELFLTGLGATDARGGLDYARLQPTVTIGGMDCPVTYAGAAPGYPGVDQINCIVPSGLGTQSAPVVVTSNGRSSPATMVAVQ